MKHPGMINLVKNDENNLFEWSQENFIKVKNIIKKYPDKRQQSAVIPLLDIAQRQNKGWLNKNSIERVAETLSMSFIRVLEVATFYSMFNLSPVGKYFVQVCTTTPCMIRGSKKIVDVCKKYISPSSGQVSENKICSWTEVECLGSCVSAPMMQINNDYYEDLDEKKAEEIIKNLLEDNLPKPGSSRNRKNTAPENGRVTLLEVKNA
jgi:NADH-quinone oxidoreductase E subunit